MASTVAGSSFSEAASRRPTLDMPVVIRLPLIASSGPAVVRLRAPISRSQPAGRRYIHTSPSQPKSRLPFSTAVTTARCHQWPADSAFLDQARLAQTRLPVPTEQQGEVVAWTYNEVAVYMAAPYMPPAASTDARWLVEGRCIAKNGVRLCAGTPRQPGRGTNSMYRLLAIGLGRAHPSMFQT